MDEVTTQPVVTVPAIVQRALRGQWVPSARHDRMTAAELGAALGCSEHDANRAAHAVTARRLIIGGNADMLAGTVNGHPERVEEGRLKIEEGKRLGIMALSGDLT